MTTKTGRRAWRHRGLPFLGAAMLLPAVALSSLVLCAAAQTRSRKRYVPTYRLEAGSAVPLGGLGWMPVVAPVKCDSAANVYLRPEPNRVRPRPFSTPIIKFSPEGSKLAVYSLNEAPS